MLNLLSIACALWQLEPSHRIQFWMFALNNGNNEPKDSLSDIHGWCVQGSILYQRWALSLKAREIGTDLKDKKNRKPIQRILVLLSVCVRILSTWESNKSLTSFPAALTVLILYSLRVKWAWTGKACNVMKEKKNSSRKWMSKLNHPNFYFHLIYLIIY